MKVLPDCYVGVSNGGAVWASFPSLEAVVVVLSTRFGSPLGENLTPAHRMGDDGVFDVVFSLEASPWRSFDPAFIILAESVSMVSERQGLAG